MNVNGILLMWKMISINKNIAENYQKQKLTIFN